MRGDRRASFVVRVVQAGPGRVSGVIERVATGAKEAFTSVESIGGVIAQMLKREPDAAGEATGPMPASSPPRPKKAMRRPT